MKQDVADEIRRIVTRLEQDQSANGSWDYPFDTGIKTDAYMIILLRTLEIDDEEELIEGLVGRILSKQEPNGAWKLFHDEKDGNLTTTVEAYYALLYSGFCNKNEDRMSRAAQFIRTNGGIGNAGMFTRILLALTGQLDWPDFPVPIEMMLLPNASPLNFYDLSVFGRSNIAPILILADRKFQRKTKRSPDLSGLIVGARASRINEEEDSRNFFSNVKGMMKKIMSFPENAREMATERTKRYMLDHIEPDGTFYSYFSATFLMMFALLSLGYRKDDSIIMNALSGLKAMVCEIDGFLHMQYTTANVWNTSLISYALQEAGVPYTTPMLQKANHYLLSRQHTQFGDWVIHNSQTLPGGWGFSDINTINPDVDDTTASLRAIRDMVTDETIYRPAWYRGVKWVLSMQNDSGGWPAFERNVDKKWLAAVPIQGAEFLLLDPAAADLTGRTLEFFRNHTHLNRNHPAMKKGLKWLYDDQEKDGSWYGRWGICYIYGTWAALSGLATFGLKQNNPAVKKALEWLRHIQNEDGGWGESCKSDIHKHYVPLGASTSVHTAWALDALILMEEEPTSEIQRGVEYLLRSSGKNDWTTEYPKGQGMAAGFYIHYHSYHYVFPLLALSHYMGKLTGE